MPCHDVLFSCTIGTLNLNARNPPRSTISARYRYLVSNVQEKGVRSLLLFFSEINATNAQLLNVLSLGCLYPPSCHSSAWAPPRLMIGPWFSSRGIRMARWSSQCPLSLLDSASLAADVRFFAQRVLRQGRGRGAPAKEAGKAGGYPVWTR